MLGQAYGAGKLAETFVTNVTGSKCLGKYIGMLVACKVGVLTLDGVGLAIHVVDQLCTTKSAVEHDIDKFDGSDSSDQTSKSK